MDNVQKINIVSPNFTGYLSDIMMSFKRTDSLCDYYSKAKENFIQLKEAVEKRRKALSGVNLIIVYFFLLIPYIFLSIILRVIFPSAAVIIGISIVVIPALATVITKLLYDSYVFPNYQKQLNSGIEKTDRELNEAYIAILRERAVLKGLTAGLRDDCKYPLALYIILESAKEGNCRNINYGERYFIDKYTTLSESTDPDAVALKRSIDEEREKTLNQMHMIDSIEADYIELTGVR